MWDNNTKTSQNEPLNNNPYPNLDGNGQTKQSSYSSQMGNYFRGKLGYQVHDPDD